MAVFMSSNQGLVQYEKMPGRRTLGGLTGLVVDVNAKGFVDLAEVFRQAVLLTPIGVARALNATNAKVNTQVSRTLAKQTGLRVTYVKGALSRHNASPGNLVAAVRARGPYIPMKQFGARETRKGVSVSAWGKRQVLDGTFMKGGRFPHRVALALGGHVFKRVGSPGSGKQKIAVVWGPAIPVEMVKDASKAAFESTVARELPNDLDRALGSVLRGF